MADWHISARTNSNLRVADIGIENDFESLTLIKRFNDVGTWALQLRRESPHLSTFLPVLASGQLSFPNGIIVSVDNNDGNGLQMVMAGPQLDIDVKSLADSTQPVLITGACDNWWLNKRRALPNTALSTYDGFLVSLLSPSCYYKLAESAGPTATDSSGNGRNGTYAGGFTLSEPGLIDDPATSALFNGSTGFVTASTVGMAVGNNPWCVQAWGYLTALPAGTITLWSLGTNALKQGAQMGVLSSGLPFIDVAGVAAVNGATAITLNQPFHLAMTWDGTTLTGYLNGNVFATWAAGPLNIAFGAAQIGAFYGGTGNFWTGQIARAAYNTGATSATTLGQLFQFGSSRFAFTLYDTRKGVASSIIIQYVDHNAGPSSLPSTAYTTVLTTHSARKIPNISLATDPVIGSTITGLPRFDNLYDFIAALALMSTTELGVKMEQSGSNLVFTVYQPSDLTASAIFSRDLYGAQGNILDYEWKVSKAAANHIFAGGSNPSGGSTNLGSRNFGELENINSISADTYLEDFLDYRSGSTSDQIGNALTGKLAADAQIFSVQATLIDQPGILYFKGPTGAGYDLGNKVTVIVDGQVFQQVIRQIQIDLQPGQPAVITPAIGTPINSQIISEYDAIRQRMQSLGMNTSNLNSNY